MAKGWLKVLLAIVAIGFGYGMTILWKDLRPDDPQDTVLAVGAIVAVASFVSLHFLTKGGGGGGD